MNTWAPISFHLLLSLALIAAVIGAVRRETAAIALSLIYFLLAGVIFISDRRTKARKRTSISNLIKNNSSSFKKDIEARLNNADREIADYVEFLCSFIDNDAPEMRDYTLEILSAMPGRDFNNAPDEWRKWHRFYKTGGGKIRLTRKSARSNIKSGKKGRS